MSGPNKALLDRIGHARLLPETRAVTMADVQLLLATTVHLVGHTDRRQGDNHAVALCLVKAIAGVAAAGRSQMGGQHELVRRLWGRCGRYVSLVVVVTIPARRSGRLCRFGSARIQTQYMTIWTPIPRAVYVSERRSCLP